MSVLDSGEAAVIELALELGVHLVCMDDSKGRRVALAVGLAVTGSLGLLVRAKSLGLLPAIRPTIDKAAREGVWYDSRLVSRVLEGVGEEEKPASIKPLVSLEPSVTIARINNDFRRAGFRGCRS